MAGFETGTNVDFFTTATLGANAGISATYRRGAYWALYLCNTNDRVTKNFTPNKTELYTQIAMIWVGNTPYNVPGQYIRFYIGSIIVATINVDANGRLCIYTGNSFSPAGLVWRAAGKTQLLQYRWYNIEVHYKYDVSGTVDVRIDGVTEVTYNGDTTAGAAEGIALTHWRFESGALTTDSIGSVTLSQSASPPTSDVTNYREGSGSAYFTGSSSQRFYVPAANIPSGFPFKTSNDTKGTFMVRCRPHVVATYERIFQYYNGSVELTIDKFSSQFRIGNSWTNLCAPVADNWFTFIIVVNGAYISVWSWNETTNTAYGPWTNTSSTALPYGGQISIGATWTPGDYFTGNIDDIWIFNGILFDADVQALRAGTYSSQSAYVSAYEINNPTATAVYIDDGVVNDTSGSVNNSWVNNVHVIGMNPRSDVQTGWTVEPYSFSHWSRSVSSPAPLATMWSGRVLSAGSPGLTELLGLEPVPVGVSTNVVAVQTALYARSAITTSPAITTLHSIIQVGSTIFESSDINLTNSFSWFSYTWETNPVSGNVWTTDDLGNLKIGMKSIR